MKRIRKSQPEPTELADYRARFAKAPKPPGWNDFKADQHRREPVKDRLREDQRGLCAYCENALIPVDESVEHFVARRTDHARELDWSNLLLTCAGGERPLPEDVPDAAARFDASGSKSCGHAKLATNAEILNPLDLPAFPRVFRFKSENGDIVPDLAACLDAGVDAGVAEQTLTWLNLRARRLSRARVALLEELLRQLATDGVDSAFTSARSREISAEQIPATGHLPAFFTTIRWFLGQGAEAHLQAIGFEG
jgi:uncharacterized protein (TIGR02646 family)